MIALIITIYCTIDGRIKDQKLFWFVYSLHVTDLVTSKELKLFFKENNYYNFIL